ncbi:MAG: Diadenosine tetraphosphatase [Chloroflexi bacterium]|nr:Diadenosine tetraphosphatase [Chloroflexota bacterium]
MTSWAFVSDVHGNLPALLRAEKRALSVGADAFACLGDVIGRGDPSGCVSWVRDRTVIAIVGNRDIDYLDRIHPELQRLVLSWPNEATASDFVVSHGDPRLHRFLNSSGEKDGFRRACAYMSERAARVWFFGHTHRARIWRLHGGDAVALNGSEVRLDPGNCYVVNVGTTGLPLPGRGEASFVVYDDVAAVLRVLPVGRVSPVQAAVGAML